ncbi:seed lectin-like [Lolium perenne]|uniref:seed lectin-like n=1 Tax=Lolium perenne TaxID=4522 RepID=UPI0021F552F4|nr:seed lectin-like [Lolium perenne]
MKRGKCFLVHGFPCLLLLVVSGCLPHVSSLSFNYNFSAPTGFASTDLRYMNDSAPVLDRIELTNQSRRWSTGRVAHNQLLRIWDHRTSKVASFTSNFTFAIKPASSNPRRGDGMAFFVGPYMPYYMPMDAPAGHLGLFNNRDNPGNNYFPPTVGVEFDTFRNVDWDPAETNCHIGVNVNSIRSTNYTAVPEGIFNGIMSAEVRYDAKAATLSATLRLLDPPGQGTYTVSANVDLQGAGLPEMVEVGLSASIGDYIEQHHILSWSFQTIMIGYTKMINMWI